MLFVNTSSMYFIILIITVQAAAMTDDCPSVSLRFSRLDLALTHTLNKLETFRAPYRRRY